MQLAQEPRLLPLPETAFFRDGSLSLTGLLICRTARCDAWRYACPFCSGTDRFHDILTDWRGRAIASTIPGCCPSRVVTLREPVEFDADGPIAASPRFWTLAGSGVLWPHWLIPDRLSLELFVRKSAGGRS